MNQKTTTEEYYNKIAKSYNSLHQEEQERKIKKILENITIKKNYKLLDVGCGTAFSFKHFNCEYQGIEPAQELINQSEFKEKITKGHAENLPFKDNTFDIVISITAIHNFKDYKKSIKEMKRVSKKKVIITILKKSKKYKEIKEKIKEELKIEKEINDQHDTILICNI